MQVTMLFSFPILGVVVGFIQDLCVCVCGILMMNIFQFCNNDVCHP